MIRPEVLDALLAAGATAEMIVAAVKADARQEDAKLQEKREADAARQRKSRQNRKLGHVKSHDVTVTPRDICDAPPPNDIYSNPPPEPSGAKAPVPPFSEKVVSAWNDGPGARGATSATKLDSGRRKALAARITDHGEQSVLDAIANLAGSDFHCGKNDRNWRVNIGWLLKSPENFMKALEMGRAADAAKPSAPVDQAAYLAKLADKPWAGGSQAPAPPPTEFRKGNTGPPRPIGDLVRIANAR
jgi:hypothetical protein